MTLAVWKFEDAAKVLEIDLSKYFGGKNVKAELIYPTAIPTAYKYHRGSAKLAVKLPNDYTARYFSLTAE